MPAPSMSSILRAILTADPTMATDEVVKKAKARGVNKPDKVIKHNIYNLRTALNKQAPKSVPMPAKSAARHTTAPEPVSTPTRPKPVPVMKHAVGVSASTPASMSSVADLAGVFSNVTLVNDVVGACGGVEPTRLVAEAVRACGSVESFLQHLDLVAALRASDAARP
jgi:hypothetical protein